ncbi:putative protein tag-52 isoform X3 [Pogonomyrmex barbatus]|uniref:Uncharacterized protein n=1 Tax=Pogonomyrmex barbatus TaxID=144034 RepID=A0A6I9VNC0_9HYME|nr:putative protein tag-52 isoform X3 [Pogonomyrmex barbatus]
MTISFEKNQYFRYYCRTSYYSVCTYDRIIYIEKRKKENLRHYYYIIFFLNNLYINTLMYSLLSTQASLSSELKQVINERNILSMRSRMKVLRALNENNVQCTEEKEKALRSQAIQEILTTEVTYLQQLEILTETNQENDPDFKKFIFDQETRPEVGRKLSSLLITPVQRVPRYQLLIKEVLLHTPYEHKEYRHLQTCLVEIEKSAKHINTLIAQNEETQKLLNLQKCIVTSINLVKPGRILIKQGSLMRVSRRGHSAYRRYFILLNDTLLYCKGEPGASLNVSCVLPLNKCNLTCVLSKKLFRITCLHETFLLYSEEDDSDEWIQSIQSAIKKYIECRQTLRKESSSRKPLRKKNINEFPSDDILKKSIKRKRYVKNEQVLLDTSNIMYFKKDNEINENAQDDKTCLPFCTSVKRFKKDEYSKADDNTPRMKNMKVKSCKNKNKQCVFAYKYLNKSSNNSYNEIFSASTETYKTSLCPITSSKEHASQSGIINKFFTYFSTSIKNFVTFR